jgi:hypothetical protein
MRQSGGSQRSRMSKSFLQAETSVFRLHWGKFGSKTIRPHDSALTSGSPCGKLSPYENHE